MRAMGVSVLLSCILSVAVSATELQVPKRVSAGSPVAIQTSGSGKADLYIVGPASASKRSVQLGGEVTLQASEVQSAGRYLLTLSSGDGSANAEFFVVAAAPANVAFLAQPSRVPVARPEAVSGTAFVMDKHNNLVMSPTNVKFEMTVPGGAPESRTTMSKDGIAWVRLNSSKRDGAAEFVASLGDVSTKRVVQQVASEPCNLRIHAQPAKNGIVVETDPVKDCSGNAVPDGTIVTFTQVDANGRSTVDARVKRGTAKVQLPMADKASISVASGVVVGNEIRWGGGK